ncbi:hypothetical protein QQ045_015702 [Rhodiola kirilowii]
MSDSWKSSLEFRILSFPSIDHFGPVTNATGVLMDNRKLKRLKKAYDKVLSNGPKNAKYTSSNIQKQIANILGNKVRAKIREEIGDWRVQILYPCR